MNRAEEMNEFLAGRTPIARDGGFWHDRAALAGGVELQPGNPDHALSGGSGTPY